MQRPKSSAVSKYICVIVEMRIFISELLFKNVQASQPTYHVIVLPVGLCVPEGKTEMSPTARAGWQQRQPVGWCVPHQEACRAEPWLPGRAGCKILQMVGPFGPEDELESKERICGLLV